MPFVFLVIVLCLFSSCREDGGQDCSYSYHFDGPARIWEECLPLGNGRIGMMSDGGVECERIVLNESSLWSGSRQNSDNPRALESLPRIRALLLEGRNVEAQELMYDSFVCSGQGTGQGRGYNCPYGSYQLLGNLVIEQDSPQGEVSSYRRELNLGGAVATEEFSRGSVRFKRTHFASYSDDVAVVCLDADRAGAVNFRLSMNRDAEMTLPQAWDPVFSVEGSDLVMRGTLASGREDDSLSLGGMKYAARVRVLLPKGGKLCSPDNKSLAVEGASRAVVLVAMATDYLRDNVDSLLCSQLDNSARKTFSSLLKDHSRAFGEHFNRVSVDFGHNPEREALAINDRLISFEKEGGDPSLIALYYQFGRYLLISSTRCGCLPPNLQGLWANTVQTPWNGDYHLNINLQMNYWPAESGNLSELHRALADWVKTLVPSGEHTAKAFYGARGWTAHTPVNVWEFTAPGEHPSWGATNTCAAWLCEHLFEHYLFSRDREYLEEVYPTMRASALFFVDMMAENPENHYLVTAPTNSPENSFLMDDGRECCVVAGSTMDNQIVRELLGNVIASSEILGIDSEFADTLRNTLSRIKPTTIGPDGRIMEWMEPYREVDPHHRHVSHLFGLYPSNEISMDRTPELAEAARCTLNLRGDVSTGWSMAWKINFWARLRDGNRCYKLLRDLLHPVRDESFNYRNGGGTYPNLFCAHPPFQIDGNFGGAAGIAEMLIQSQDGFIRVLPALPDALGSGSFKGLCVRGGGVMDARWEGGRVTWLRLKARSKGEFFVKDYMKEPVFLEEGECWSWKK